jgi:hypothetical protein
MLSQHKARNDVTIVRTLEVAKEVGVLISHKLRSLTKSLDNFRQQQI